MNERCCWLKYEMKYYYREFLNHKMHCDYADISSKYAGYNVMNMVDTNRYIYDIIMKNEPYAIARIGGTEMSNIAYYMRDKYFPFRTNVKSEVFHNLFLLSGFFPEKIELQSKFVERMLSDIEQINMLGIWNRYMEEWAIGRYGKSLDSLTRLVYLEPMRLEEVDANAIPWTAALEGKKVLVIHPFTDTIITQYLNNREKIFSNIHIDNILPEFELHTIKAVQSLAGNHVDYDDWFIALDAMEQKIDAEEFDVALIGCGAYGLPLAAYIRQKGKIAIHMGGATQLLFGIRGSRWDWGGTRDLFYMNEYWVRPSENEKIGNMKIVEGNCYW